ncbi:Detected protein of unknown function [Hibiscus syriacus]|uniref:Uncharacterized protein n=1 Tax=Hibiscus syriacus TaxID=106335 RepID=A0A6A3ABJ3_HIBSY|nr:Detected protein of unknown function [Hibiscus syriacus]
MSRFLLIGHRVVKEKNALAERLKTVEAERRRFDEELKRYATENVTREEIEIRQSPEDKQYIHTLEASLQEEMSRHVPLYGAGLEALSMKELETLSRIEEEGPRQIHALQQRKGSPLMSPHTIPHDHGLFPTTPPPPMTMLIMLNLT